MHKTFAMGLLVVAFLAVPSTTFSATYRVPDDFGTIRSALDAAVGGDTIIVRDGTWTGPQNKNLDFNGKAIALRSENGPENCIIDCENDGRGFEFRDGETLASVVDGFTITNGGGRFEGAIWCSNASPSIVNCIISNNSIGGIVCYSSSSLIMDCIIKGNSGNLDGGIHLGGFSSPTIMNCTISENSATESGHGGGGICSAMESSPTIIGCTISNNWSEYDGGGIGCSDYSSGITVIGCVISGNTARRYGGGIFCDTLDSSSIIANCTITGNSAISGGGISCYRQGSPFIAGCTISGNSALVYGGGIHLAVESPVITNCILWENLAHMGNEIASEGCGDIYVDYSDVQGGQAAVHTVEGDTLIWGQGNIDADPVFVASGYRYLDEWIEGDYHLAYPSPCIDSAMDAGFHTDIDGEARPFGGGFDMGSDEFALIPDHCPTLDSTALEPATGHTRTTFRFSVHYRDEDGDVPTATTAVIDGIPHEMTLLDGSPADGTYYCDTKLGIGPHQYSFSFYDGAGCQTRLPADGSFEGPLVQRGNRFYVPDDYAVIQEALDDCADGDTIIVRDGVYTGEGNKNLSFRRKALTLRSENGSNNCILDCEGEGRGFIFFNGEGPNSILDGFTITNGLVEDDYYGSGIRCENFSSPTITGCALIGNSVISSGGAISCYYYSSPIIANCSISENTDDSYYGCSGISCNTYSDPDIKSCIITDNSGNGISCYLSSPTIANCLITGNSSGIATSDESVLTIKGCTIANNGRGIRLSDSRVEVNLTNSIVWGNTGAQIGGFGNSIVSFSDIQDGFPGLGNISTDPLFVSGALGDFYLSQVAAGQGSDSPCVDAGIGLAADYGLDAHTNRIDQKVDEGRVDMGYHYPQLPELLRINCVSPPNESVAYSPPTFTWTPYGGTENRYAADFSFDPTFSQYWSTFEDLGQPIRETSWAMPQTLWNAIPSGSYVYWRMRGINLDAMPLTVLYSDEIWWFYKP